VLFWNI